jgi:hypothetical protein
MVEQPQFWFNVRTGTVETDYDKSQGKDLMGPYLSADEASRALQSAAERTEKWDEQERRWREGDDED